MYRQEEHLWEIEKNVKNCHMTTTLVETSMEDPNGRTNICLVDTPITEMDSCIFLGRKKPKLKLEKFSSKSDVGA